jgi:hypothetical protein
VGTGKGCGVGYLLLLTALVGVPVEVLCFWSGVCFLAVGAEKKFCEGFRGGLARGALEKKSMVR